MAQGQDARTWPAAGRARVVVVDSEPVRAEGLRQVLSRAGGLEVVGSAREGREALRLIRTYRPDVVIVEGRFLDSRGVEGTRRLRAALPGVRQLVLAGDDDPVPPWALRGLGLGESVPKTAAIEEIVRAVRAVAAGEQVGGAGTRPPEEREPVPPAARALGLTARQFQLLRLLDRGWRNKRIAEALVVTERTVEFHVHSLLAKLGVRSRGEATAKAREQGIDLSDRPGSPA